MHHALGAVNHHHHTVGMRDANRLSQVRATTGDVRHLSKRQNAAAGGNQLGETGHIGQKVCAQRKLHHTCTRLFGHHQPRHQVGVMFRLADDDLIARLKQRARVALGHHIDGLGGAARPDDIFPAFGIDQVRHAIACGFVARG